MGRARRPSPLGLDGIPGWAAPWLRPSGRISQAAFAALDPPLKAWATGEVFDAADYYSALGAHDLSAVERDVRAAGPRVEWRVERVWQPDEESSPGELAEYEAGVREVADRMIHPRCLDDYASMAYGFAELGGWSDGEDRAPSPPSLESPWFEDALAWGEAGVCLLQLSLPWPFIDCLPCAPIDNRPVHRLLYAYASLLQYKHPRKAKAWFRAMVFMNPGEIIWAPGTICCGGRKRRQTT